MIEEKVVKPPKARYWEQDIVAFASDREESSEEVEKPLVEEKPYWPTLDELVSKAKAFEADHHVISLSKRSPQLVPTIEAQEEPVNSKKLRRPPQKRGFIPRRQPFKLWIEEHKKKIAEGKVPTKAAFVWEALEESRIGELDEMREYMRKCGNDWEAFYGENFDPVFAERELRAPGVRREGWQRMKDKREPLRTEQSPGLEWKRLEALEEFKKANAEAQEERRRQETLDEEANRLKDDRIRHKERYRQMIEAQGGHVRERLSPNSQKDARRKAKAEAEKIRRAEKKVALASSRKECPE
jgi:hypothetical protein